MAFYAAKRLPPSVVDNMNVNVAYDYVCGDLVATLHAYIYGVKGESGVTLTRRRFASPWQAFKQRCIDAGNPFFLPENVRYVTDEWEVTVDLFSWWPDLDVALPKAGAPIRLVTAANWSEK